jgi:hypothetical protein
MRPWRQTRPHWDYAAELLLKAAETREEYDIEAVMDVAAVGRGGCRRRATLGRTT